MQNILSIIAAVVAIGAGVYFLTRTVEAPVLTDAEFGPPQHYGCLDGKSFRAEYGDGVARVTLPDGMVYTLESRDTTVGALYSNEGSAVELATEDNAAALARNGNLTHVECVVVQAGADVSRSGTITVVDTSQAAFDGPLLLTLHAEDGMESLIAVPSMGLPLCEAYVNGNIEDPFAIQVGNKVEVAGTATAEGLIVPCRLTSHYLRVVE